MNSASVSFKMFDNNRGLLRRVEYMILRAFIFILGLMPFGSAQRFARTAGAFAYSVLGVRRSITEQNLRAAFPDKDDAWITRTGRGSLQSLFLAFFEFFYSGRLSYETLVNLFALQNMDVVHEALKRKKGIIFMTGHFGNWELLALSAMMQENLSSTIIVKRQKNHFIDEYINSLRTAYTNRVVYMKESVREILTVLARNGIVAIVADQSAPRDSVYVPFFKRNVATFGGPAFFALKSEAPLVMSFSLRQKDGSYRVVFEEVHFDDLKGATKENIKELTARHTAVLEKYIRASPDHWLWQHKRWKHVL